MRARGRCAGDRTSESIMDQDGQSISNVLHAHKTFEPLSRETLQAIASVSRMIDLAPGETFIREGEESKDLFLLVSGTAAAVRDSGDGSLLVLNTMSSGDCIGELAFLDGGRRTASVRAETPCRVIDISADAIAGLANASAITGELKGALASVVVSRARTMSDDMLASLRHQLEIKTLQNQFGYFLLFTISLFLISSVLFYHVTQGHVENIYDPGFSWQTVFLFAIPCLIIIKAMKIPLSDLGLRKERFWRSLLEAVVACVVITIPVSIYFFGYWEKPSGQNVGVTVDAFFVVQYFIHIVFQEIGSRGLLQGLFQKFLGDERGHRSILMTSAIFASLHLTFGMDAVLITFFASLIFGYVYVWQKNLIGVIVIHYWLGLLAAMIVAF